MPSCEASLRNLEKAKACWRKPRPWRSLGETQIIRRLTWQWYVDRQPKCSGRELADQLGVSHTYVQKLVRHFINFPARTCREMGRPKRVHGTVVVFSDGRLGGLGASEPATYEQLRAEQECSRRMRERGLLRPLPYRKTSELEEFLRDQIAKAHGPARDMLRALLRRRR